MSRTNTLPPILTNTREGLSPEEIGARFPSILADDAPSMSTRYMQIKTYEYLDDLREQLGYVPTTVMHQKSRSERPGQLSHGKHLIRFSHVNDLHIQQAERHEIVLVNSHNGTSSFQFMSGIFRFICQNGMILADLDNSLSVQHRGSQDMLEAIRNAVWQIAANSVNVMEQVERFKQIMLTWEEQLVLAEAAMMVRFDDKVTVVEADSDDEAPTIDRSLIPFQPQDFLRVHRWEDQIDSNRERSLYTTGQVLQENMVGKSTTSRQRGSNGRRGSARALTGIDGNVKVNAGLWLLQQRMAELKG